MVLSRRLVLLAAAFVSSSFAAPLEERAAASAGITILSTSQVSGYKPYSYFAASAYCGASNTLAWSCGPCAKNKDFKPVASGGNGGSTEYWFVGYSPSLKTVIVSHQGTDPLHFESVLTDIALGQERLDSSLFPGVPSSVMVHSGFKAQHARTAASVLAAVQTATSKYNATSVALVGHSLGAALALLDAVYLPLHLPNLQYRSIGYGMPRVGNQAFADYVDAKVSVTRVNNKEDLIPILPGRSLGYHHPSGEIHIQDSDIWKACSGQDNTNAACTVGDVPNILLGNILDHVGLYDGVTMGICI